VRLVWLRLGAPPPQLVQLLIDRSGVGGPGLRARPTAARLEPLRFGWGVPQDHVETPLHRMDAYYDTRNAPAGKLISSWITLRTDIPTPGRSPAGSMWRVGSAWRPVVGGSYPSR
jgi:hypothetical protein